MMLQLFKAPCASSDERRAVTSSRAGGVGCKAVPWARGVARLKRFDRRSWPVGVEALLPWTGRGVHSVSIAPHTPVWQQPPGQRASPGCAWGCAPSAGSGASHTQRQGAAVRARLALVLPDNEHLPPVRL